MSPVVKKILLVIPLAWDLKPNLSKLTSPSKLVYNKPRPHM
jgi:hypothetical protein